VKQHFLVDLPAGVVVAVLAYRAVYGGWPLRRERAEAPGGAG